MTVIFGGIVFAFGTVYFARETLLDVMRRKWPSYVIAIDVAAMVVCAFGVAVTVALVRGGIR